MNDQEGAQAFAYIAQVLDRDSPALPTASALEHTQASADAETINESETTACPTNT